METPKKHKTMRRFEAAIRRAVAVYIKHKNPNRITDRLDRLENAVWNGKDRGRLSMPDALELYGIIRGIRMLMIR